MSDDPAIHYCYALYRDGVPFYVGKGKGRRWLEHEQRAVLGEQSHKANIIRAILASGQPVEKRKLAEGLSEAAAHALEVELIATIGRRPNGPLVNRTNGGEGIAGFKHSAETRAKIAAAHRGMKASPEAIAKMRAKVFTDEMRRKNSAAKKGRKQAPDVVARRVELHHRGRKNTPETIARMRQAALGRVNSAETRAKISLAMKARPPASEETRARISAALLGRPGKPHSEATKQRLRELGTGRKLTDEHRAAISASSRGRKHSAEHIAARVEARRRNKAKRLALLQSGGDGQHLVADSAQGLLDLSPQFRADGQIPCEAGGNIADGDHGFARELVDQV